MNNILKIILLALFSILVSCGSKQAPPAEKEAIQDVISKNVVAWDSTDLHTLKKTMVGADRAIEEKAAFAAIDNSYRSQLESLEIVKYSDKKATVNVVIYKKATDKLDSDVRQSGVRHLVKKEGEWKISKIEDGEQITVTE